MNRSSRIAVLILLVLAGIAWVWPRAGGDKDPVPPAAAGDDYPHGSTIAWYHWEASTLQRARREDKGLFVYFHGQWCTWCRRYQSETLEHPDTIAAIQRDFLPTLVNLDQRRDLFTRLGGRGLPYTVLLDADGELLGRFTGHVAATDLQGLLDAAARRIATGQAVPAGLEPLLDGSATRLLGFLDKAYDPARHRLSGISRLGTLSKRPQPMTYRLLLQQAAWRDRIPPMLDVLRTELYDPVDGGFFFFSDPDQPDPAAQVETSKLLGLNALLIWLYADAYQELGRAEDRDTVVGALNYLRKHLWDATHSVFWGNQFSDPVYYASNLAERARLTPPRVEPVQYADVTGQAIVALVRAAEALNEPAYLHWAAEALQGLDRQLMHPDGSYYHYRGQDEPPQLYGYLPAQLWPAAAWWAYHAASGDARAAQRGNVLLAQIAAYEVPALAGFTERRDAALSPWAESRSHAVLAWLLAGPARNTQALSSTQREHWLTLASQHLQLQNGGDPDDMALGALAQQLRAHE